MSSADLELRIARLTLAPGDVLVAKAKGEMTSAAAERGERYLRMLVPHGVRVMVIDDRVDLSVLTKAEIEDRVSGKVA